MEDRVVAVRAAHRAAAAGFDVGGRFALHQEIIAARRQRQIDVGHHRQIDRLALRLVHHAAVRAETDALDARRRFAHGQGVGELGQRFLAFAAHDEVDRRLIEHLVGKQRGVHAAPDDRHMRRGGLRVTHDLERAVQLRAGHRRDADQQRLLREQLREPRAPIGLAALVDDAHRITMRRQPRGRQQRQRRRRTRLARVEHVGHRLNENDHAPLLALVVTLLVGGVHRVW